MTLKYPLNIKSLLAIFLVAIVSVAVYGNTLNNSFVYDDELVVEECRFIKSWRNLLHLFNLSYFRLSGELTYRPIVTFTYLIDYSIWKLKPLGYHLTNLFLHTINGILIFLLIHYLLNRRGVSLACTLLFVTHPITSEAVNVICFREDLLALTFFLLSFLSYLKISSQGAYRSGYLFLSLGFFLFGLFSKEMVFSLPFILLLYEVSFGREGLKKLKKRLPIYFGFFSVLLFYSLVRFLLLRNINLSPFNSPILYHRILTQMRIIVFYLKLSFFPLNLSLEYLYPFSNSFWDYRVIFSMLLLLTILIISIISLRLNRSLFFGTWWFFLTLLPVSNIVPIHNPVAERYLYLPLVGFCLVVALTGEAIFIRLRARERYLVLVLSILLFYFYSYQTIQRNQVWKNRLTLYQDTLKSCPKSARFLNNLGLVYAEIGKNQEAIPLYKKAIEINPNFAGAYNNLGLAYSALGKKEEAITLYKKAIEINSNFAKPYSNLGLLYTALGKNQEAITLYKKAIEIDPDFVDPCNNLGVLYINLGKNQEAITLFKKAIEIDPDYAETYNNLGLAYINLGKNQEAMPMFKKAIEINPNFAGAYNNLGLAYSNLGKNQEAIAVLKKVVEIDSNFAGSYYNLGNEYSRLGKNEEAITLYKKTIEIDPTCAKAYNNLGNIYYRLGRMQDAIASFKKTIEIDADFVMAYHNLSLAYYSGGEYKLAIEYCDKARERGIINSQLLEALERYRTED